MGSLVSTEPSDVQREDVGACIDFEIKDKRESLETITKGEGT